MVRFTWGYSKVCRWSGDLCYRGSCDWLLDGNCVLCSNHGSPNGRFMLRVVKRDFSKFSFVVNPKRRMVLR